MSTDNPSSEDVTPEVEAAEATPTPEEELQASAPEAPADEPVAEADGSGLPELTLGDGAPAEAEELVAPSVVRGKIDRFGVAMGTGRRKTSVARVRIKDGNGEFTVNGKPFDEFFCVERDRKMVQEALNLTGTRDTVNVWVRVNGGGTTGQTGAVVLGVARALQVKDPSLHHVLATGGFLTRDDRMVERKKYGRRKARRSFQFSKR
ncbi:MAG: 30S ribosomal protein S9 [Planctomycetota bacterium]|jgi:small subunit ribosomal protein S9|nr:30S ribosomal protein S9 [Planctomycetota bacterium]MDA0918672.1 30S ribosomal protein S9 [Planctomycetota bacterium]MDA1158294.1 30S ribosomal protein S9 [Planctomycetota bacterium]